MRIPKVILCLLLITSFLPLKATHIIGGDFNYRHISGDLYELHLKMYRDCRPEVVAGFNIDSILIGIYDINTHQIKDTIPMGTVETYYIEFQDQECVEADFGCVQTRTYIATFSMPASIYNNLDGYYISWERCCRNSIIKNIKDPGEIGMTFYMEVPSPHPGGNPILFKNNSPVFNKEVKSYVCLGSAYSYNFNVTDPDGDSLVYTLVTPLKGNTYFDPSTGTGQVNGDNSFVASGPYPEAEWENGYSLGGVMDAKPPNLGVNSKNGEITVFPTEVGAYVLSILVEEFRAGLKIGEVRRELQFFVISCIFPGPPDIQTDIPLEKQNELTFVLGREACFFLTAIDSLNNDVLEIIRVNMGESVESTVKMTPENPIGLGEINAQFCWTPDCSLDTSKVLYFQFIAKNQSCIGDLYDTTVVKINLINPPNYAPDIIEPAQNIYFLKSGDDLWLDILAQDTDPLDKVFLEGNFAGLPTDGSINIAFEPNSDFGSASSDLSITTLCNITEPVFYNFSLLTFDSTCAATDTNEHHIQLVLTPSYYGAAVKVPTAFSPNNDGINDVFQIFHNFEGDCNYDFNMQVFNRWGARIFQSNDPNFVWDAQDIPEGIYVYLFSSLTYNKSGTLTIIR